MLASYAARLTLAARADAGTAGSAFDQAAAIATDWLGTTARRAGVDLPPAAGVDGRIGAATDAASVEAEPLRRDDRLAWRGSIAVTGPAATEGRSWLEIQLRPEGALAVVTLRLLGDGGGAGLARLAPTGLVRSLLTTFLASVGTMQLSDRPSRCGVRGVGRLVRELTDPAREVPIVVVSSHADGSTAIDYRAAARDLAGLAKVVRLADFETAFALTDEVGKPLSCFDGAVRIYWPGFMPGDDRFLHPLWTAATIAGHGMAGAMPRLLLRRIGAVAAERIEPDAAVLALARAVERDRARELARRRRETAAAAPEQTELLDLAWQEIEQLRARIGELERENADLHEIVARGFSWQAAFGETRRLGDPDEEDGTEPDEAAPNSLAEAVHLAAAIHAGPHVEFAEAAAKSAEKAPFQGDPREAYRALVDICAVAKLYHTGELTKPFLDAFRERGRDFRANVSPTALGHHPNHYTFTTSRGRVQVGPHLALGRGNRRTSLRIYWHVDGEERRFVICHVGEHLPDTTT